MTSNDPDDDRFAAVVPDRPAAVRLDAFLTEIRPGLSRRQAAALIAAGGVRIDGKKAAKGTMLAPGRVVELLTEPARQAAQPDDACPLTILYEDEALLAVAKPAGYHSAPLRAADRATVAQALLAHWPELAGVGFSPLEPGLCQRLDFWTSGVLVAAKSADVFAAVRAAFAEHRVRKEYLAFCAGAPPDSWRADAPIAHPARRSPRVETRPAHGRGARPATTQFTRLRQLPGFALVRAECATGAMHQVRVHAAHGGFPLLGDELYGGPPEPEGRFWLHAAVLELPHPRTRALLRIACDPPSEFLRRIGILTTEGPEFT